MEGRSAEVGEVRELMKDALVRVLGCVFDDFGVLFFEEGISMVVLFMVGLWLDISDVQERVEQILVAILLHLQIHKVLLFDEIVHG